jgi:hypothetical protein
MSLMLFLTLAIVIEHVTDMFSNLDPFEDFRTRLEHYLLPFGLSKIVRCKFCQSFWLSGLFVLLLPGIGVLYGDFFLCLIDTLFTWLILHKTVILWAEVNDRFLGRIPKNQNLVVKMLSSNEN